MEVKTLNVIVNILILIIMQELKNVKIIVLDARKDLIVLGLVNVDINIWNISLLL